MDRKVLVINGPNVNFIGKGANSCGSDSYENLLKMIEEEAEKRYISVECFQSNYEGALIDRLQQAAAEKVDGIIINPGALMHYSYALYDCLLDIAIPKIEVHHMDIYSREPFRRISVTSPACDITVQRGGADAYVIALDRLNELWGE